MMFSGWPRHAESREFGSNIFQTGKAQNFAVRQGKFLRHRENIWTVIINTRIKLFCKFQNCLASLCLVLLVTF